MIMVVLMIMLVLIVIVTLIIRIIIALFSSHQGIKTSNVFMRTK